MKNFILFLTIVFSSLMSAQTGAKIEFRDKDNTIDFGKISVKENGVKEILFTNVGDSPLIIINIQSTCGCIVVEKPKEPILPGKTGIITLKYDMRLGPIRRSITIESNAVNTDGGRILFKLKGEVVE
jgi:hypothetical protein